MLLGMCLGPEGAICGMVEARFFPSIDVLGFDEEVWTDWATGCEADLVVERYLWVQSWE